MSITTSTMGEMKSSGSLPKAAGPPQQVLGGGGGGGDGGGSGYVSSKSAHRNYGSKKKGGGGKYTWGRPGQDDEAGPAALDPADPNYDSAEEEMKRIVGRSRKNKKQSKKSAQPDASAANGDEDALTVFKERAADVLREYFASRDVGEAAEALQELGERDFHHKFVQIVLRAGLERKPGDRELCSFLLSSLYGLIFDYQYVAGFAGALDRGEDLVLDNPDAAEALGRFIARAVADDLLAPSFLKRTAAAPGSVAAQALDKAEALLDARLSGTTTLDDVWINGGATVSVAALKRQMVDLVSEFLSSLDADEAARTLRDIDSPAFHFQFVKIAIREALDAAKAKASDETVVLLKKLHDEGLLSLGHLLSGCRSIVDSVADLTKDVSPKVVDPLVALLEQLAAAGLIPLAFPGAAAAAIPELLATDERKVKQEAEAGGY